MKEMRGPKKKESSKRVGCKNDPRLTVCAESGYNGKLDCATTFFSVSRKSLDDDDDDDERGVSFSTVPARILYLSSVGSQSFVSAARRDYGSFVRNFHKRITPASRDGTWGE